MDNEPNQTKKVDFPQLLLWVGFISLCCFPILFTRSCGFITFNTSTGVIGDTIGGITAPVSGFLGAFLVYRALREQVKANKIITDQFKEQKIDDESKKLISIVTEQLKMLRQDIKSFQYVDCDLWDGSVTYYYGKEAIKWSLDVYPSAHSNPDRLQNDNSRISEIKYFLGSILYLVKKVKKSGIELDDKEHLLRMIFELYNTKMFDSIKDYENRKASKQGECKICQNKHGIPDIVFDTNDQIIAERIVFDLGSN